MSGGLLDVTLPELSVGPSVAGISGSGSATIPAIQQDAPQAPAGDLSRFGFSPEVNAAILQAASNNPGVGVGYLAQMAKIESGGRPNAFNEGSKAAGLYQFIPGTARAFNLSNPFDPQASADAAAKYALENKARLQKVLGRDPTDGELYLAHQQGGGGASKILANPDAPVSNVVPVRNITSNGGSPDMTGAQFANLWTSKFGQSPPLSSGTTPGAANPGMGVGSTAARGGFGLSGIQAQGGPVAGQAAPAGVSSLASQPMTAMGPTAQGMMPGAGQGAPAAPQSPYGGIASALQGIGGGQGQQKQGSAGGQQGSFLRTHPIGLQQARQLFDPSRFYTLVNGALGRGQ